jgi:hypothetical protein
MPVPMLRYLMPTLARRVVMPSFAPKTVAAMLPPRAFSTTPSPQLTLNQAMKASLSLPLPYTRYPGSRLFDRRTAVLTDRSSPLYRKSAPASARATPSRRPSPTRGRRNRRACASRWAWLSPRSPTRASARRRVCVSAPAARSRPTFPVRATTSSSTALCSSEVAVVRIVPVSGIIWSEALWIW